MTEQGFEITSEGEKQTQKVGEILAREILQKPLWLKNALVIGLIGDLGSGKTTFVQGVARGLGIKGKITSPTFVILKKYPIRKSAQVKWMYHLDCYRIGRPQDLVNLDIKEIIKDKDSLVVIEWAEKIKESLPINAWQWQFQHSPKNSFKNQRRIIF